MNHYKIIIQFEGSRYFGWQIQPDQKTIQGTFNSALEVILKTTEFKTIGSGRTDAGVHAAYFVVKASFEYEMQLEALKRALNSNLPEDIRVLDVQKATESFRPTNDAKDKTYHYLFTNNKEKNVFSRNAYANISYELDIEKMKAACELFVGEHDFKNFCTTGSEPNSTLREIYECELWEEKNSTILELLPAHYVIKVRGNGFLKQMVRLMVGTIWSVGRGKISLSQLQEELCSPGHEKLGFVAPAEGLYKVKVRY
jgi:tRNA pseudouridine38-40 synthase